MKCHHEVPCTCSEYLNGLPEEELMHLRVQFGLVITDSKKAIATGHAVPMFISGDPKPDVKAMRRADKKQAVEDVERINQVLEDKFGYVIL